MRLDHRPLLDHRQDARMFTMRAELDRLLRSVNLGLNVVVHGSAGSGKTTLIRHAAWRLRNEPERPDVEVLLVSAAVLGTPEQLLLQVLQQLGAGSPRDVGKPADLDLLDDVRAAVQSASTSVMVFVDDMPASLGRAIFGRLRDEVWQLGITWVVACADTEASSLLLPPVDAFFETDIQLQGLDAAASRSLVRQRLVGDGGGEPRIADADVDRLSTLVGGNPRRLIEAVRSVIVEGVSVSALVEEAEDLRLRLSQVSRGAAELAAQVEALGPVSPSDPRLQARMGVSRPRLVQLFHELRDAAVVEEGTASADGPGRPRVLYRLRSPLDRAPHLTVAGDQPR